MDVLMPTYNSESHLDDALSGIERCINVNRIIAVDKGSTDRTLEILKKHGAFVISDQGALGHARQLLIENATTEVFFMLDSDVVLRPGNWIQIVSKILERKENITIVLQPLEGSVRPLQRYLTFWWRLLPRAETSYFDVKSTFLRKSSLAGIKMPDELGGCEDFYIHFYLKKVGQPMMKQMNVPGMHYYSSDPRKGRLMGASLRLFQSFVGWRESLPFILRNVVLQPFAVSIAALYLRDSEVLMYGMSRYRQYVAGYIKRDFVRTKIQWSS